MKTIDTREIQELYELCGLDAGKIDHIRGSINLGKMNSKLNSDFSHIYGNSSSNNLTNMTIVSKKCGY